MNETVINQAVIGGTLTAIQVVQIINNKEANVDLKKPPSDDWWIKLTLRIGQKKIIMNFSYESFFGLIKTKWQGKSKMDLVGFIADYLNKNVLLSCDLMSSFSEGQWLLSYVLKDLSL